MYICVNFKTIQMKIRENVKSVYVIYNRETKKTKIGVSDNPERRVKQLEYICGCRLELHYYSRQIYNWSEVEIHMHKLFSDKRTFGEWFECEWKQPMIRLKAMVADKEECRIISKYNAKVPVTVIAERMGVSRQGLINYLKYKGAKDVPTTPKKRVKKKALTGLDLERMVKENQAKRNVT